MGGTIESGQMLFLVGLAFTDKEWDFCGIFDTLAAALERCTEEYNFIAKVYLNNPASILKIEFPNIFYPNKQEMPEFFECEFV